jgi:DNA mismatch endonuclease, patch repair protein
MPDIVSKEKRSEVMSKIRGKDTKIELLIRRGLFARGFRFRKNDRRYPGIPDIVLPKYKTMVFVNGCFWHGHEKCKIQHIPKSSTEYWQNKINRNIANDKKHYDELRELGWNVIVVWECELKGNPEIYLEELVKKIKARI